MQPKGMGDNRKDRQVGDRGCCCKVQTDRPRGRLERQRREREKKREKEKKVAPIKDPSNQSHKTLLGSSERCLDTVFLFLLPLSLSLCLHLLSLHTFIRRSFILAFRSSSLSLSSLLVFSFAF